MTNFKVDFCLLTKNDFFYLTRVLKETTLVEALNKAKQIAFSEYNDNIIALKVYNDKQTISVKF